ncbi:MAG TPA: dihydrolipoamide acetyltransferase family protein [Gaiellaceae bacterium]|jgi:pyruvate dehydrogenase E2 component (dihydrolipoamide acetyltransferase)
MAEQVTLPRLGQGMESGTIVRWLKAEGDEVEKGEPLYELDTDKVTQEVEADVGGVLLKILVSEGEVPVGTPVAFLGEAGEDVPAVSAGAEPARSDGEPEPPPAPEQPEARHGPEAPDGGEQRTEPSEPASAQSAEGRVSAEGRIKASPLARRIARERHIDLASLKGTGPEGRIVAEDVERATVAGPPRAPARAAPGAVERVELTSLRKTVARRMTEAWTAPAFQISMSADMSRAQELRARLVERHPDERPTVTDVLTKVCAAALMRHREVNALYAGDAVELHPTANVGIAVATDRGLLVPVIAGCESLTTAQIAAARADLVARARDGKLQADDLEGGTFTISNLGMYGVEQFVAVLNPPQAAILAVGGIEERPVAAAGELVVRPMMTMTLTCDHRTIDGATAADFLRTVKEFLEEPGLAL